MNNKVTAGNWWAETFTSQIFPVLVNDKIERLSKKLDYYVWRRIDEKTVD